MMEAVALSREAVTSGEGGPFGCVVVKNDRIIARGHNKVLLLNDPTAHAEIVAIRQACEHLGSFQLDQCEIYTSCEPCPMCLGAIYWARPRIVYYANTRADAAAIGFDDSMIYDELSATLTDRKIPLCNIELPEAGLVFKNWVRDPGKMRY